MERIMNRIRRVIIWPFKVKWIRWCVALPLRICVVPWAWLAYFLSDGYQMANEAASVMWKLPMEDCEWQQN